MSWKVFIMLFLVVLLASMAHFAEAVIYKKSNAKTPSGGFLSISTVFFAWFILTLNTYLLTETVNGEFTLTVIPYGILAFFLQLRLLLLILKEGFLPRQIVGVIIGAVAAVLLNIA